MSSDVMDNNPNEQNSCEIQRSESAKRLKIQQNNMEESMSTPGNAEESAGTSTKAKNSRNRNYRNSRTEESPLNDRYYLD